MQKGLIRECLRGLRNQLRRAFADLFQDAQHGDGGVFGRAAEETVGRGHKSRVVDALRFSICLSIVTAKLTTGFVRAVNRSV